MSVPILTQIFLNLLFYLQVGYFIMKIAMILDATFPPDPRVENEAIALIKAGHEVVLFSLRYAAENKYEIINDIHVHRYKSNKLEYKLSALAYTVPFYTRLMAKKIERFITDCLPDAIHIHDIRIAEAVFKVNKSANLPVVLDLHDNLPEVMKLYPHLQKFPGKYIISPKVWKKKEDEFIKKADKVVTVSPHFIKSLINRFPSLQSKFVLVPNTIDRSFYENYIEEKSILDRYKNEFVILYLGDTHLRRGLQTAIQGAYELNNQIPNLKLVIVGKNTTDNILKKQVRDLDLENIVDFEGWQDVSLFPSYILASDICISPLHRNLQHDVAYANKIFQYMSFGKPLLVSDATAQKELVETHQTGSVHKERDVSDFVSKVLDLYQNKSIRDELGKNGQDFVRKHYTWEKTSKALLELYNQLNH